MEGYDDTPEQMRFALLAAMLALDTLTAAGFVVLRVPQGTAQHGDELELDRERCSLPAHCMAWFDPRLDHVAECKPAFLMRVRRPVEVNND